MSKFSEKNCQSITNKEETKIGSNLKRAFPIILLLFLVAIVIGTTYAVYTLTTTGNENSITTGVVSMSYTESTNVISIENALPISDSDGKTQSNYFDFSVTSNFTIGQNNPNVKVIYDIDLQPLNTNTLEDNKIKVYLEDVTSSTSEVLVEPTLISNISNYKLYTASHTHEYNVDNITTNYRLRAWIDYSVDATNWSSSNKYEYKFRVNINGDSEAVSSATIPEGSALETIADSVTSKNISYKYISNANVTENGITYNNGDNGVFLYNGTDDNGGNYPIYYYRGNVTNNNVIFEGYCWKIVRTTSTGGIKLIYNGTQKNGTCDSENTSKQLSLSIAFNKNTNSPAYLGYMYGIGYSSSMQSPSGTKIYGNDVTYSNGTYTLVDTTTSTNWGSDRTTLANGYHYTCFTSETTCTSVYYIYYFGNSRSAYYLTFTGGDTLESAKEKMFTNTTDSTVKTKIDNWYSTNLASNTNMLENTIFCNDRTSAIDEAYTLNRLGSSSTENGGGVSSKDTNAVDFSYFKSFENTGKGTPSLQCSNQNDRFSLKVDSGGTEGYGNNALTYPIGLLTYDEVELAGSQYTSYENSNYYLCTGSWYWVMSPARWTNGYSDMGRVDASGRLNWQDVGVVGGVRPSISLKLGTEFETGTNGTASNPYIVVTE